MSSLSETCAREMLDAVPLIMRAIRKEMRCHRDSNLSIPQFRAMLFIHRNRGVSLSQVAEHLGLTPPTTSRLIEGLVKHQLISRNVVEGNRRQVKLTLLTRGESMLKIAQAETQKKLSTSIVHLSEQELIKITEAIQTLKHVFSNIA